MIFITDELGKFEKNIIELAENVGFKECKTIEAIDLFCGISEKNDVLKEKDRYYAFIDIPQYWSVRADGLNGAIYDNKTKKANIYFKNPIEKRMVSRVEWIDRNNTVYKVDYYNKYGYKYCSENVRDGNVISREFYDRNGDIKVIEQTGPKTYTTFGTRISPRSYRGFADYLEAYLKSNEIYDENIWLTSDEILNKFAWDYGNFKISYLPQNRLNSDLTVITQTNTAFRILCSEEQQVNWYKENSNYKCDRLYSYLENNKSKFGRKEAFIITETDQLEYIEQLINDFQEITFHIAASTIMSDKLTRLDINNNVELYPCITEQKRKELFERCDIYLDINHYRTQEGFEGYYMMRGFGCPFILVTDPRSEGGAFYLGDSEFEQMITDYVTDKLDELGLTKDELVLSGASMGTFGSLYYGSKLSPHALLLAKPLANMGNVARNERILRAGGFATSLDILMKNYDNLSDEAIEQLNNRMWDRFDSADWSHTKFIISYLYEDDYDPDGYPSILSHLKSSGVEVYGKGSHGRHTDNSANVMAWFKSQYNNLLHDDFSR